NVFRKDAMRADDHVDLTRLDLLHRFFLFLRRPKARQQLDLHWKRSETTAERVIVLISQHSRRRENRRLLSLHHCFERSAHRAFRPGLGLLPAKAAESVQLRRMTLSARITLDQVETFDRHVELCFVSVIKQHELAGAWSKIERLQTAETCDAVIDVDHIIIGLEIAEVREKSSRFRLAPPLFAALRYFSAGGPAFDRVNCFIKNVSLDVNDQSRLRQFKTTAETTDCHDDRTKARCIGGFSGKRQACFDFVFVEDLDDSFSYAEARH